MENDILMHFTSLGQSRGIFDFSNFYADFHTFSKIKKYYLILTLSLIDVTTYFHPGTDCGNAYKPTLSAHSNFNTFFYNNELFQEWTPAIKS